MSFLVQCLSFLKHCTVLSKNWKLETEYLLIVLCPFRIEETWSSIEPVEEPCHSTVKGLWGH